MADRVRQTFQATFRGINTRRADLEPPGKFPLAVNVRNDGDGKVRTRPGYEEVFDTGAGITDLGSYSRLFTDGMPRVLAHDNDGNVYLDDGQAKGRVGTGGPGASMIPFRPSASPQSWMYIANPTGFEKFQAPDANNNVLQQKVGIAEPQPMAEAVPDGLQFTDFTGDANSWDGGMEHWIINPAPPPAIILARDSGGWTDPVTGQPAPGPGGDVNNVVDVIRSTDTILGVFPDPIRPPDALKYRYSLQVTGLDQTNPTNDPNDPSGQNFGKPINYQVGEILHFGGSTLATATLTEAVVEDVYPAIDTHTGIEGLVLQSIYYFDSGHAIIVPSHFGFGNVATTPDVSTNAPPTAVLPDFAGSVAILRRGSLLSIGGEIAFVESVTLGPTGSLAIEVVIGPGHQPGEPVIGVLAICCSFDRDFDAQSLVGVQAISSQINFVMLKGGLGFMIQELPINPFNLTLGNEGIPQDNDLFHISLTVAGNPQRIAQIKISFDIDDGSFLRNTLYYPVSESVLQATMNDTQTQFTTTTLLKTNATVYNAIWDELRREGKNPAQILIPGAAITINNSTGEVQIIEPNGREITLNVPLVTGVQQYTELTITLSSLTRTGNNMTRTLADCNAIQIAVITSAFSSGEQMVIGFGSIWVGGGGQPDVGKNGSPYYYRVIGRNSLTGAVSNPSPGIRYGVMPRVQPVWVQLTASTGLAPYDPQIDTWDIFRFGGTITSWRYVGSANFSDRWFRDDIFDSAAVGGDELQFDNFQPWPTVDVPWHTSQMENIQQIDVVGTVINIHAPMDQFPASIFRWLAGTLITLNLNTVYTLWNRPVPIPGGWQLRITETAGTMVNPVIFVQEPIVANQSLPYLVGPDSNGILYACGDPFRPGTFQPSKPNNPDATSNDAYDLTPPSEPLLGGQTVDGIPVIASSRRWWQLQPSQNPNQVWNPVETPSGRGLAAPYGHCTDGQQLYFWAKDSIRAMVPGIPSRDLTSADIGNIFPQGDTGITIGFDIEYAGKTIYAPDYRYAAQFRLSVMDSILRAHYVDRNGKRRTLVCDMTPDSQGQPKMAWSVDEYADPMTVSFQPGQPPAALFDIGPNRYTQSLLADSNGRVWTETDIHNDGDKPIPSWFATPEWDAGDERVRKEWLDSMIDLISPSGGELRPVSNGEFLAGGGDIPREKVRTQHLIPLTVEKGEPAQDEPEPQPPDLGILIHWRDDFREIHVPTTLYKYSLEFIPQPVEIKTWESLHTSCGLDDCYWFIPRLRIAYETAGDDPVHLRIEMYDGTSPEPIDLPGTRGQYRKTEFVPTFNKGMLAQFTATSQGRFAILENECEIMACAWGRTGPCVKCNGLGGNANP